MSGARLSRPAPADPIAAGLPRTSRSDPPGLSLQVAPAQRGAGLGSTGRPVGDDVSDRMIAPADFFRWFVASPGFGVKSRSRFLPAPLGDAIAPGHAGVIVVHPVVPPRDPAAGRTFFPPQHYAGQDYHPEPADRGRKQQSLGASLIALLRGHRFRFESRDDPGKGGGSRLAAPVSWSDAGPWAQGVRWLYSHVRPEAFQGAQTFRGGGGFRHTRIRLGAPYGAMGAKYSSYPRRMHPPRVYRLTDRQAPPSYGSQSQVLGPRVEPGTVRAEGAAGGRGVPVAGTGGRVPRAMLARSR